MRDVGRSRTFSGDLEVASCCEVLEERWVENELKGTWVGIRSVSWDDDGEGEEENCCGTVWCCGCGENAPDAVVSGMSASGKSENDAGIGRRGMLRFKWGRMGVLVSGVGSLARKEIIDDRA